MLAVVLELFAGSRMEGGDVAAAVAATSDDKISNGEQDDNAAADSTAAVMTCRCCCGCAVVMIGEGQLRRNASSSLDRSLSSSCPSHAFWNLLDTCCCPALLLLLRNSLCR